MDIFGQLGINTTAAFQFVLFAIAITFLTKFVFTPYARALSERQNRTRGEEDLALEFQNKSLGLKNEYETRVRELSAKIKDVVDSARHQAMQSYDDSVAKSRSEAEALVQKNRSKIASEVRLASEELRAQTSSVAIAITTKLLK